MTDLEKSLTDIKARMARARASSPLSAKDTELIAVSKGQPEARIEAALALGLTSFGENRVQEAQEKWRGVKREKVRLHLIGALQTNKVKEALELFDVIHTIDRMKLAEAMAKETLAQKKLFLIQVNTGEESQKAGVMPAEADAFIESCVKDLKLPIVGLMCIPPALHQPAAHFAFLREMAKRHGLAQLSIGMSGDFEEAVKMGATMVRIGTALFGERPAKSA